VEEAMTQQDERNTQKLLTFLKSCLVEWLLKIDAYSQDIQTFHCATNCCVLFCDVCRTMLLGAVV
jgi:hypothetical protein